MLRPSTVADADAVSVMAGDFEVVRHTGTWPWPADRAFTKARCGRGFTGRGGWLLAYDGAALVGMVGLREDGDLGYMLARAHWGRGYATEMGRAVVDFAFGRGGWARLRACVFDDNPASARVLQKLDFTEGPACRGQCAARGDEFPIRNFTLTRTEA